MSRRRAKEESGGSAPAWITTFSDLMSLLLCFFIMLFAFSTVDVSRFKEALISLQGALGVLTGGPSLLNPGEAPLPPDSPSQVMEWNEAPELLPDDLVQLKAAMEQYLDEAGISGKVIVETSKRGLLVRFTDTILFDLGKADLRPDSRALLSSIGGFIAPVSNEIIVEGHADNYPLRPDAKFATNWELSAARAVNVVRYFTEDMHMRPERFSAAGYGEFRPVVENTTEENKAMNRRVDIVLVAGEDDAEPAE